MKTYKIEFVFSDDFDIDVEVRSFPMSTMLDVCDFIEKKDPSFKKRIKTKASWEIDSPINE